MNLPTVFFIDNDIGWAAGGYGEIGGLILKTTDGGDTWPNSFGTSEYVSSVYFIDNNTGWAVGNDNELYVGIIRKTTDGGTNWDYKTFDTTAFSIVYFTDQDTGWVVGGNGTILNTINGGANWNPQTSGTTMILESIHFVDNNTGWAVGENGTILKTTTGGVSFVEENEIDELPTDFILTQNYPNPFNPSTKIRYSIPQSSYVVIKVFDILGNEIETLANQEKPAGTYEITWYAENLPSGIYFYRLQALPTGRQAGSFVETKNMILLR